MDIMAPVTILSHFAQTENVHFALIKVKLDFCHLAKIKAMSSNLAVLARDIQTNMYKGNEKEHNARECFSLFAIVCL